MKDSEKEKLVQLVLAPYLQKATALIGLRRRVGGNQFRHAMATLAILIDYHYTDPVLLKASVIHDLFEDVPDAEPNQIKTIDPDGPAVVDLVLEVTRNSQTKAEYLERIRSHGSLNAKILKVADRISNVTDLNGDIFDQEFIRRYLDETERFVYPIAQEVNSEMAREIRDLIDQRRSLLDSQLN